MEIVKRFGLWIVAAAIVLAGVGYYIIAVRGVAGQHRAKVSGLESTRDQLKAWTSKTIPSPTGIEVARKWGEQISAQLDDCALYLARQPRNCQTRTFFEDEILGQGKVIPASVAWLLVYRQRNTALQKQIDDAGFGTAFRVQTLEGRWGAQVPKDADVTAAMELYWLQKDLADFLTDQVETDLGEVLRLMAEKPDAFPSKPSDLVINRRPGRLDEFLRALPSKDLVAVLSAILINPEQQDLAMIFNKLLPDSCPWDRPPAEQEKPSVLSLIMDEAQRKSLDDLVPPDKPDLADRQRFLDFVRDLRTVRYRVDVVGLLESRRFEDIAPSIRRGTEEEHARVLQDISTWGPTKLAQAIAAVVSIQDEKDYRLLRSNHRHHIVELARLTIRSTPREGATPFTGERHGEPGWRQPGPPTQALSAIPMPFGQPGAPPGATGPPGAPALVVPGVTELYVTNYLTMRVRLEFEHIPVFLRDFLNNSWRYRVRVTEVGPAVSPEQEQGPMPAGGLIRPQPRIPALPSSLRPPLSMTGGRPSPAPGPPAGGLIRPQPRIPALPSFLSPSLSMTGGRPSPAPGPLAGGPAAGAATKPEETTFEVRNYAWVDLECEAYQFTPLMQTMADKLKKAGPPAAPPAAGDSPARGGQAAPSAGTR